VLKVRLGNQLAPTFAHVATKAADWLAVSKNQVRVQHDVHEAIQASGTA